MRVVVAYESMYGNTHLVAQAIGEGLGESAQVAVVPVVEAAATLAAGADLLVVGGPTHVHGMSRPRTRTAAADAAKKPESGLTVEPEAEGPGVRELLESLGTLDMRAAAFDTRIDAPAALDGTRFEEDRTDAPPAPMHLGRRSRKLPGHQGLPPRAGRGGSCPAMGRRPRGSARVASAYEGRTRDA